MEFTKTTLGEISIGKGQYGIGASAVDYSQDLYTYLRITDINDDGTLNILDLKSVDDPKASDYLLSPNDIVFARTGNSTGRNYFYDGSDGEFVYAGFLIKFSLDPIKVNPRYIKYYCLSDEYKGWVQGNSTGSTRGNINAQTYAGMDILLPPREQQDKLVKILDDLEAKRKTNSAINRNLLDQANAFFQSWFVEYEPFGGSRPDDWKEGILDDIIEFSNGYAFKSNDLLDAPDPERDCYHVFKQGHINRGGGFNITGTKSWYPKELATNLHKYVLHKGDVLMAMTDMKDNVAILGNTAIMEIEGEYIVNQRVGLLRPTGIYGIQYPYISLLTNSYDFLKDLRSRANSGVQVNLSSNEIRNSLIYIAPESVNKEFNELVMPLFEAMIVNDIENLRLVDLRDGLLPKLMSGEIDVSNLDI